MEEKMEKYSWNKDTCYALKFNKFILWPLGLWPSKCDDIFSWFRTVFAFTSQVYLIYVQLSAAYLKCGDASDIVDFIMMAVCAVMAISKIIAIRVHMDKIKRLFNCALEDWNSVSTDEIRQILRSFAKTGRSVFFFQIGSCYAANIIITVGTLPFLMPAINQTVGENATLLPFRQLPFKTGCLFAHYRDEIYGSIYAYESVIIHVTAHGNVGCDVFLISLAMHLCSQLEMLKLGIAEIKKNDDLDAIHREIAGYIRRHIQLLNLAKDLDGSVSKMLVVQLLLNAGMNLLLGIRVILAVNSGQIFDAVRPLIAFNVLMLQLYLLSYASDRLSQQSESVVDAVYDSNWYELPAKIRKELLFMTVRANRPMYLMAGKFYEMNIENFKNVLKASFSYFSILRVMFDG